jgi:hypothetical protein
VETFFQHGGAHLHEGSVATGSEITRWFKYERDYLCVNKSQFVPVIFEPPCIYMLKCNV